MLYLKCTLEVQKVLRLKRTALVEPEPSSAPLGNWYVHRFSVGRRNAFIFVSDATFLSFILYQGRKPVTTDFLPNMFLAGLEQLLQMKGLPQKSIDQALNWYQSGGFSRTDNRSDMGVMKELIFNYQWLVESNGGLAHCDLTAIILKVNSMIQRRLDWHSPWDIAKSRLFKAS